MPLVTVGLPFFNDRHTLADAIRSVLAQTLSDWELLLVDDGSSDGSLELARLVEDPRVRVFSDGKNRKLAARLNQIAREARGELIARMDADDLMHPARLDRQVAAFAARPGLMLLGTGAYIIDEKSLVRGKRGELPLDLSPSAIFARTPFIHPTVMMRTSWARANPYDESLARVQDLDLWCRTFESVSADNILEPLHFYREANPFNLKTYLLSNRVRVRLIGRLAPRHLGKTRTLALQAGVRLRSALFQILWSARLRSWLASRRSVAVLPAERRLAQRILDAVRLTPLPSARPVSRSPKVSIGLPVYNGRATLASAVRSVFAQTLQDWELIIVDDGSTDGSLELARSISDPRVRVLSDGKRLQLAARLNQISQEARGPLVARMDADDLMHPERLARQLAFLELHPEIDLLGSGVISVDEAKRPQGIRGDEPLPFSYRSVLERGLLVHPTVVVRTEWARANPYSLDYVRAEDFELWARVFDRVSAAVLPEPLLFYREPSRVNLKGYALTQESKRAILWRYGPRRVGTVSAGWMVAACAVKELTYRAARLAGREAQLVQRRNRALTAEQSRSAGETIALIERTQVPGLPPG